MELKILLVEYTAEKQTGYLEIYLNKSSLIHFVVIKSLKCLQSVKCNLPPIRDYIEKVEHQR
jgi:hypothetical protein